MLVYVMLADIAVVFPTYSAGGAANGTTSFPYRKISPFCGVAKGNVLPLLQDLKVRQKNYKKGEFLFYSGDPVTYIGLVLEGSVHIIQEDYWGNRNILSQIPQGFFFGEALPVFPRRRRRSMSWRPRMQSSFRSMWPMSSTAAIS